MLRRITRQSTLIAGLRDHDDGVTLRPRHRNDDAFVAPRRRSVRKSERKRRKPARFSSPESEEEEGAQRTVRPSASHRSTKLLARRAGDGANAGAVPLWASLIMLATVVGTAALTVVVAQKREPRCSELMGAEAGCAPPYLKVMTPLFFVLMAVEFVVLRTIEYSAVAATYRVADAWSSISAGLVQQLVDKAVLKPLLVEEVLYFWIQASVSPSMRAWVFPVDSWLGWVLAFFAVDCCYYWLHRWAHEYRLLWAGHSIHHSGEHYNLSTALRQSWQQATFGWVVYMPMALFCPFPFYIGVRQLNLIYQFWVHTCVVRRMGPLEHVLMTPSHHRVHHDRRVHKNFGGMFILWDRIFGTFLDENVYTLDAGAEGKIAVGDAARSGAVASELLVNEPCLFGTRRAISSWTDSGVQLREWFRCCGEARATALARKPSARGLAKVVSRLCKGPGFHTTTVARFPAGDVTSLRLRAHSAFGAQPQSEEHDGDGAPTQQLCCSSAAHAYIAAHFVAAGECSFMYRYILRESCSHFDSLPLTSLPIHRRALRRRSRCDDGPSRTTPERDAAPPARLMHHPRDAIRAGSFVRRQCVASDASLTFCACSSGVLCWRSAIAHRRPLLSLPRSCSGPPCRPRAPAPCCTPHFARRRCACPDARGRALHLRRRAL
jgi:alkylglycerol monooxygenase